MIDRLYFASRTRLPLGEMTMDSRRFTRATARLLLVTGALLLTSPAPAPAGSEEPLPRLSLEQAVEIALRQNPDVLRARQVLAKLDGQIEVVKSAVYPQVGLEADYFRSHNESIFDLGGSSADAGPYNNYAIRGTVNQLLFSWGKASTAIEISKDSRQRAEDDLSSTIRAVKLQVYEAFYSLLLDQRLVDVAEQRLEQRRRQLGVAEKKFEAGVVNEFEVVRARVDVASAEPSVIRSKNRVRQDISRINNLLARDQRTPLDTVGELTYEPINGPTLEQVVERAVAQRPELKSLRTSREAVDIVPGVTRLLLS